MTLTRDPGEAGTLFPVADESHDVLEMLERRNKVRPDPTAIECRHHDLDTWFPSGDPDDRDPVWRDARAICARCPERIECLTYSIQTASNTAGMYGGLTPNERKALRRRIARLRR